MRNRAQDSTKTLRAVSEQNSASGVPNTAADLSVEDLARRILEFLYDCEYREAHHVV